MACFEEGIEEGTAAEKGTVFEEDRSAVEEAEKGTVSEWHTVVRFEDIEEETDRCFVLLQL